MTLENAALVSCYVFVKIRLACEKIAVNENIEWTFKTDWITEKRDTDVQFRSQKNPNKYKIQGALTKSVIFYFSSNKEVNQSVHFSCI